MAASERTYRNERVELECLLGKLIANEMLGGVLDLRRIVVHVRYSESETVHVGRIPFTISDHVIVYWQHRNKFSRSRLLGAFLFPPLCVLLLLLLSFLLVLVALLLALNGIATLAIGRNGDFDIVATYKRRRHHAKDDERFELLTFVARAERQRHSLKFEVVRQE